MKRPRDTGGEFDPACFQAGLCADLRELSRPATGLCVAFSGGLDSTVLLNALASTGAAPPGLVPRAVHVDHGLQAGSAQWSRQCAAMAAALGFDCRVLRVDARPPRGASPEAWARKLRREALARELAVDEVLLTAQHADDQLETVFLQLLRGGGPAGIAGMPRVARFGPGWQARPLLGYTRAALERWAVAQGLAWIEDPSNLDTGIDRNFLRHEILPALRTRWPHAATTVGQAASFTAETVDLAANQAATDLARVSEGGTIVVGRLECLPPVRQRAVLRAWFVARGLPLPSAGALNALRRDLWAAAADRVPCARWQAARVYRYRGRLYAECTPPPGVRSVQAVAIKCDGSACGEAPLELRPAVGCGLSVARLPGPLELRPRRGGERFQPPGSVHRRPLRKWLQERGVLPWLRDRVPLLYSGELLVAVGDLGCDTSVAAQAGETSLEVRWPGRPILTEAEALSAAGD